MKLKNSNQWKTDPRAAYIPGAVLFSFVMILCLIAGPAWSFEMGDSSYEHLDPYTQQNFTTNQSSPPVVDSCLPLLKSIHTSPQSAMDRNQRSAGKAAALGLVLGVRFALSPPEKPGSYADKPRLNIWKVKGVSKDSRSALAVSAYRQCQKEQALKALSEFRWAR